MIKRFFALLGRASLAISGKTTHSFTNPLASPFVGEEPWEVILSRNKGIARSPLSEIKSSNSIDEKIIIEIFNFFEKIPPFYDSETPKQLQIGGAWKSLLQEQRINQLNAITEKDIDAYKSLLESQFDNELMYGLWNHGPRPESGWLHPEFLIELDAFERVSDRAKEELVVNDKISNWGLETSKGIVRYTDPQHGIQANWILKLLELKQSKNATTILDIGSGFGGMAEKLASWSTKPLQIICVDIPLNLVIAYAHLARVFGKENTTLIQDKNLIKSTLSAPINSTRFILVPSIYVDEIGKVNTHTILHNGKSFSEMEADQVAYYIEHLLTSEVDSFVETNSNRMESVNYGHHQEVISSDFPIPPTHKLAFRVPTARPSRYVTSVYFKKET